MRLSSKLILALLFVLALASFSLADGTDRVELLKLKKDSDLFNPYHYVMRGLRAMTMYVINGARKLLIAAYQKLPSYEEARKSAGATSKAATDKFFKVWKTFGEMKEAAADTVTAKATEASTLFQDKMNTFIAAVYDLECDAELSKHIYDLRDALAVLEAAKDFSSTEEVMIAAGNVESIILLIQNNVHVARVVTQLPWTERIIVLLGDFLVAFFEILPKVLNWLDSHPIVVVGMLFALFTSAVYIANKLNLFVWNTLCAIVKLPVYLLLSFLNFLFGTADEEVDAKGYIIDQASAGTTESSAESTHAKTVYAKSEFLSSGLPRSALHEERSAESVAKLMGEMKDFQVQFVKANQEGEEPAPDTASTETASAEGSAKDAKKLEGSASALFGSAALAVAAFAVLI